MFDNLFAFAGPVGSSLMLFSVVAVPLWLVIAQTVRTSIPELTQARNLGPFPDAKDVAAISSRMKGCRLSRRA